uniref:Uncharacterized protein n=1 Tax=Nelumbo nucifera TaxID=4432 RepID=A0A822Y743_NELNU|nr:TPA_asm: hypothetical protein HUJ06_029331 [Nelumbo nucifera]
MDEEPLSSSSSSSSSSFFSLFHLHENGLFSSPIFLRAEIEWGWRRRWEMEENAGIRWCCEKEEV